MKRSFSFFDLPRGAAFPVRWMRRLAIGAAAMLLVALAAEGIARLVMPGRSSRFLIAGEFQGQPAWIDNQFFTYRFFPERIATAPLPVVALKSPADHTLRICLLGGAAAMGMPDPAYGLGRQLEWMLQHRYPDHVIEVIPMAVDGGNSHVLREVARDIDRLRPHAVIVLAGNEEVAGPYGPASGLGRFHHSSRIARTLVLFSRTRLSQLLVAALDRLRPARMDLIAWRRQEPITLRGRMDPDDPRLHAVARSFRKNLTGILEDATRASPAVILCTVPVNLRDSAPFSTSFLPDETAAQEVRETLRAAIAAETAGNRYDATRLYGQVIRLHPTHAEALFRAAQMSLAEERHAEASSLFLRARDADALRLRVDTRLNGIIRDCAAERGVSLLDAEKLFADRSPHGIPGHELFHDHIHFTFEGHRLLALSLIHRLEFLNAFDAQPSARIPAAAVVAGELLYDPWGRAEQVATLIRQQLHPLYRRQITHSNTLARLNSEQQALEARIASRPPVLTREIFARQQAGRPNDAWLASKAARHLLQAGDPVRAEQAAKAAYRQWPHRFDIRALLALTRAYQGEDAQDGIAFLRRPGEVSGYYDIHHAIQIGRNLHEGGRHADARPWLEHALERDAWNSEAAILLADTLYHLDEASEGIELLQAAIKRNPRNPLLWEEVAVLYTLIGDWDLATECFAKSEELAPYRYERLLKWAEALFRLRQYRRAYRQINRYLTAMPDDPEALALLAQIQARLPSRPEASPEPETPRPARRFPWE